MDEKSINFKFSDFKLLSSFHFFDIILKLLLGSTLLEDVLYVHWIFQ